jgi:tetratricopeptide (TPR) repeat protein
VLNQAKTCLRGGNWREALQVLGERNVPPNHLVEVQRIDWYWLTGWALVQKQKPDDAIRRLQEGLRLAEQLRVLLSSSQQVRLAEAAVWLSHFLGSAWCASGQTALAYDYHFQCREAILDGTVIDPELKLLIYSGLGRDALVLGHTEESISAYKDAVRQAEDQRNPRQRGFAFWGLGLAYQAKEDFLRAKASYRQAIEALNRHEDLRLLAQVRNLLGHVLFHLGEWKQAERQFRFSLDVVRSLEDYNTWGYILGNLAELYGAQGHWEDSIEAARAGVLIAQKCGDTRNHGQLHLRLASAYAARHDVTATEEALQKAMALFEEITDLGLLGETRTRYAEFLQQQGRFQDAYEYMRLELVSLRGKGSNEEAQSERQKQGPSTPCEGHPAFT